MPASQHQMPAALKDYYHNPEMTGAVRSWKEFAGAIDLSRLGEIATKETDVTPDGDIYEVETPEGLLGDFVVVDMRKIKADTPHYHTGDEVEVHIPLSGEAVISIGAINKISSVRGKVIPIGPEEPHFIIPNASYITGVLSLPNYNPDNQISIDVKSFHREFNKPLYDRALNGTA